MSETIAKVAGLIGKLGRAAELPRRQLAAELAWRPARSGLATVAAARTRLQPAPGGGTVPFLLAGARPGPARFSEAATAACVDEAEAALAGRFEVLGHGRLGFGMPPLWSSDPVSETSWPLSASRLAGRVRPPGADIKVPWEASRMHWLTALARAHARTGDDRYRAGAVRLLDDWAAANPPGVGVSWCNTMEVGIRAVNLVWAAEIFADDGVSARAGRLLREHGWHIVGYPEYSPRLTSNHFLADVVGLAHIGGALRDTVTGRAWLRGALAVLEREILKQFDADGMNFEASTGYHRLSTELAVLGAIVAERAGRPLGPAAMARIAAALDVCELLTAPDGLLPPIGDDDSGLIAGLSSGRDPLDPAPVVAAGRALLTGTGDTEPDEWAAWAGGGRPVPAPAGPPRPRFLAESGRGVLADGGLWCLVECGGVGQLGNGGHAHNDTLSFVLHAGGQPIVTDPGSYTYTRDPAARDRFRATAAHATIEIDGEEINRLDRGLFSLTDEDAPVVELAEIGPGKQRVVAAHAGYRRLPDPVTHRREWLLADGVLTVRDELECRAAHRAVVTLPLATGVRAETAGGRWLLRAGPKTVALDQLDGPPLGFALVPITVARRYGAATPSTALRATVAIDGGTGWTLRFTEAS